MIFKHKLNISKLSIKNNSFSIFKLYSDLIFILFLIKEYLKIKNMFFSTYNLKCILYIVNIFTYKCILNNIYSIFNRINIKNEYLFLNIYKKIMINLNCTKRNVQEIFFSKNIFQKVLKIQKISKTRAKGKIKRYKVMLIIGNKNGWFGIGYGKDQYISEAISKARLNAYKNIYTTSLLYSNILKNNKFLELNKNRKLLLLSYKYKTIYSKKYILRVLFDFLGLNNINSKLIKIKNTNRIIDLLIN